MSVPYGPAPDITRAPTTTTCGSKAGETWMGSSWMALFAEYYRKLYSGYLQGICEGFDGGVLYIAVYFLRAPTTALRQPVMFIATVQGPSLPLAARESLSSYRLPQGGQN